MANSSPQLQISDMISEATVLATYRGFRYMFRYKDLVSVLNSEIKNVGIQEERVSEKVDQEKDNGKTIEEDVLTWQKKVKQIQDNAKEFMERYEKRASWGCIKRVSIPNPLSRFRLGREAAKKTKMIADLTTEGNKYVPTYEIARNPPHKNLPNVVGDFQDFQSRKDAYENIWQLLITEGSPQIIGIYGLPGVGKTRIADQIWKEAKENGIFNKVIKAVVSGEKDLDIKRLQNELAGDLNCRLESQDDIKHRASQLKHSIINGDKVLVILDDVWRKIPSHDIGIPIGDDTSSKGCKVLFTSREKKVCLDNDCVDPVEIRALTDDEAWDMFENSAGAGKIKSLEDESLAKKVCKKCAGLPLLLCAVGKALRNMSGINVWNDALDQFQNCKIERIPGIDPEVYACLKLSYDNLVHHDAKACLLLCSLYPEDAIISTSMLIELGIGSKLLPVGRSRVLSMVDTLKSSSLVVGNEYNEDFKLHDVIRAVARSIAVNYHSFLFARSDSSFPQNNGSPSLLCLEVKKKNFHFPSDMVYDEIYTLWIESISVQKHTFQVWEVAAMAENLGCLILRNIEWVHQIPVQQLGKLRSLVLHACDIREMDFSFISEHLETLCIWNCALPEPLNIKNLKYLRKLEILGDMEQVVLVDNTISSLSSLEELHIPFGYRYGDEVVDGQVDSISQLVDIGKLTSLKSLKMTFGVYERIQDPNLFPILSEFDISVVGAGRELYSNSNSSSTRLIYLSDIQIEAAAFQSLIERAEEVRLFYVDVDVSSIFGSNREAFSDLKVLDICHSDTMEHLARISHPHQIQPQTSFSKLTTLDIKYFSKMKYLFCNSVAKCLVQLKQLCIHYCPVMEAIIMNEGGSRIDGQEDIINFSKLRRLKLSDMPKLKGFNMEKKDMHSTSTISLIDNSAAIPTLSLFSGEVAFPALEALELDKLALSDIWGKHYYNDNASSFCKLKSLKVFSCTKLETVIPLAMLHKLQNLEYLEIKNCSSMVSEVGTYGSNTVVCPLVALTDMHLENLPCLTYTWLNSMDHSPAITLYPNLKKLKIRECNSLNKVFLPSIAGDMMHLEILHLDSCKMMTEIIGAAAGDNISKDVFLNLVTCYIMYCDKINLEDIELWRDDFACQLKSLHLRYDKEIQLPELQIYNLEELTLGNCWWHEQIFPCFSRLRRLEVTKSGRSTLFPFSVISSLQQLKVIEISECALLENIMEDERGNGASSMDKKIIEFIQLREVFLNDLPKLGSFMSGANYECHMPALKCVYINNCGFSTLFMCCRYLQLLDTLEVRNCRLLEYIVEDIRDDEISKTNDKIITFSLYWPLRLGNLPNLKSFSRTSSYAFNMPNLEGFELHQCPQFENFSSLKTTPGRSISVYSDWHEDGKVISDLNDYIKQNRKRGSNLISDSAEQINFE